MELNFYKFWLVGADCPRDRLSMNSQSTCSEDDYGWAIYTLKKKHNNPWFSCKTVSEDTGALKDKNFQT